MLIRNHAVYFHLFILMILWLGIAPGCVSASTPFVTPAEFNSTNTSTPIPSTSTPTATATRSSIVTGITDKTLFLFGANYPWHNYGTDFGENAWGYTGVSTKQREVESDFGSMSNAGIQVVRWFVFTDGRASPDFAEDGSVIGLDDKVFPDLDAALEIAHRHNIHLILVLLDFHWLSEPKEESGVALGGHTDVIEDPGKRETFFQNALIPLIQRYGQHPSILAWEIINEPEWAIGDQGIDTDQVLDRVQLKSMQDFVSESVEVIHANSLNQLVTIGGASRRWWHLWEGVGLDVCQFHYYDWMEDNKNSQLDFPYTDMEIDIPCLVGEFPTAGSKFTLDEYYQVILNNQYAGALPWSLRNNDINSDLINQLQTVQAWSQQLTGRIIPTPVNWRSPTPPAIQASLPVQTLSPITTPTPDPDRDYSMYGFESREDEWVHQDYEDSQAVYDVHRVHPPAPVFSGQYSLQLDVNLIPFDDHLSKGEVHVQVLPFPPSDDSVGPYNLENSTITCWVYLPPEAYANNAAPWIGFQVFAKDEKYRSEYGEWKRLDPATAGMWRPFILKPRAFPPPDGYMDRGFDPTVITTIGVKIGVDDYYAQAGVSYNGSVFVDACNWE